MSWARQAIFLSVGLLFGCPAQSASPGADAPVYQQGVASFYSDALAGRPTASGTPYDPSAATCAHKKLPFGTVLRVERVDVDRATQCTVNDRGPFHEDRIIDLSRSVAETLGIEGIAEVRLRIIERPAVD